MIFKPSPSPDCSRDQARELEPLEEEVIRLRDEVDVLRPAEMKLAKVEESLSR